MKEYEEMKGSILSGGKGTRLRPFTHTQAKQLLPLANKPILFYAIESLLEAGIREIGIVVGDVRAEIQAAVGNGTRWGQDVHITYIHQEAPFGLAHAVKIAQSFLSRKRFVMFLGDNLISESLAPLVQEFAGSNYPYQCSILLAQVSNPSQFGVAELEEMPLLIGRNEERSSQFRVRRLVEKPSVPLSNLALVGVYFFDHSIFEAIDAIQPSYRGELEITDAIQWLIDHGYDVHAHLLQGYWIDTGNIETILAANRKVLETSTPMIDSSASVSPDSMLYDKVIIQAGAHVQNSIIRGPAIVGERSIIHNVYVGPFTSIYHDVLVETSEVECSIILEHSRNTNMQGRIQESIIGRHAEVSMSPVHLYGYKLIVGDYDRVGIPVL